MSGITPVSTYTPPVNTTQNATAYKANIDGAFNAFQRVGDNFAPRQATTPAMTVSVDPGAVYSSNSLTLTELGTQTSGTITAPAAGNFRIDRAVVDSITGVLSIVTGTPTTGTPSAPSIPAGAVPVARIALTYLTTVITNSIITDERCFWNSGSGEIAGTVKDYHGFSAPIGYLFSYGQAVSRTTYAILFSTICLSTTGTNSSGSAVVTAIPSTTGLAAGMPVSGTGVFSGSTILSVDSGTQVTLSHVSTSAISAFAVCPNGVGDGSTTFNLPDYRGRTGVGVDNMGGSLASRITNVVCGIAGFLLGAVGGDQNLHGHTHTNTATSTSTDAGHSHIINVGGDGVASGTIQRSANSFQPTPTNNGTAVITTTTTVTNNTTGTGASQNVQPAIMCNKIIKT